MPYMDLFGISIAAAICTLFWLFYFPSRAALVGVFCFTLLAIAWASFINWVLKDGLGPDSVESVGIEALKRFGKGMLFSAGVCGLITIIAISIFLLRRKK